MVGASCTAELIQDDPGGLAQALGLPIPVIAARTAVLPEARRTGARRRPSTSWSARWPGRSAAAGTARAARGRAAAALQHPRRRRRSASATATTSPEITQAARPTRHRRQRRRAARRDAGRPRAARRGRLQRRALSGDRRRRPRSGCSAPSASRSTKTVPIGVGATRDFIAEVGGARRASMPAPCARRRRLAAALVLALGRFDLPHRQARLHLRRRHACDRGRAHRRATSSASRSSASAPTAANSPARCASRGRALRRRGADHRRLPRGRGARSPSCSPNWCSARRWSATSPSASAFPAR